MKDHKTRLLLFLLPLMPVAALSGQTELIDLYLGPDIQSEKVTRVSLEDPRLGQPTPVLDEAKAALGWHFADFSGETEGYVPDAKIGKDLLPVDNTIIYSGPSESSSVLGVYQFGQDLEVIDTGIWWKVRFSGGFPVYFLLDEPAPLPAVTAAAAAPVEAAPPVIEEAPLVVTDAPAAVAATTLPALLDDTDDNPRPGVIGQSYHGTFKRSQKHLGLFAPKAPYYLEDAGGDRIAWVDVSEIVIPGSIKDFLDEQVIIHGERSRLKSDWIIHAQNMRLK
jgi:hypothetical protein